MGIEATGTIKVIGDTTQVTAKFQKRQLVLELADNPKYPQLVEFQCTGDRCANLDEFNVGEKVRVEFSLRGREWNSPKGETKYFNTLDVWKLELIGERRPSSGGSDQSVFGQRVEGDDIPFISCSITDEPSGIAKVLR